MRGILCVSVSDAAALRFRQPIDEAIARLDGQGQGCTTFTDESGWIACTPLEQGDVMTPDGSRFVARLSRLARTRQADQSSLDIEERMRNPASLADLLPPFAAAYRGADTDAILVANDWVGYRQLFWWQGDGVAAVSTSGRALSVLAGRGWDLEGLCVQSMLSWQVGPLTPFTDVKAFLPGTLATLRAGGVSLRRYVAPFGEFDTTPNPVDAVAEMADILKGWQSIYLEQHPDTVLQLTGGWDSRLLLSATAQDRRRTLQAMTLGADTSIDVVIARKLAQLTGLPHRVYGTDSFIPPSPREAYELGITSAHALDCQANSMAMAPLILAEASIPQGHRFAGFGGEVARGKYYPGQPSNAQTSRRLVQNLAEWRLFSRDGVQIKAISERFRNNIQDIAISALCDVFPEGDWLQATDLFYLYEEMRRWGGSFGTVAAVVRNEVNPMWDRRFIELALSVSPAEKKDGLLLGRVMDRLDPELAAVALDTGLVPARLGTRRPGARVSLAVMTARRVTRRVRQRLAGKRKPQMGAADMAKLVVQHWRNNPEVAAELAEFEILDKDWVAGMIRGEHDAAPTTVALMTNLVAVSRVGHRKASPQGFRDH